VSIKRGKEFLSNSLTISTGKTEFFLHNRDTPDQQDGILQNFPSNFPSKNRRRNKLVNARVIFLLPKEYFKEMTNNNCFSNRMSAILQLLVRVTFSVDNFFMMSKQLAQGKKKCHTPIVPNFSQNCLKNAR